MSEKPTFNIVKEVLEQLMERNLVKCVGCGKTLKGDVLYYEHDGGVLAEDGKRYWIYVECRECGYQNAWWKLFRNLGRERRE